MDPLIARLRERADLLKSARRDIVDEVRETRGDDGHLTPAEDSEFRALTKQLQQLEERAAELEADAKRAENIHRAAAFVHGRDTAGSPDGQEQRAGQLLAHAAQKAGFETRAVVNPSLPGLAFSPPEQATWILDFLAADSVALKAGFRVVRTSAQELRIPHTLTDPASNVVAEAGTITPTDPTAETVVATPKKIAALTVLSNEVIEDSEPPVLNWTAQGLLRSLSLKLDQQFLEGTGVGSPTQIRGLKSLSGITTVTTLGANGAAPTNLDVFSEAISALETNNATPTAILMHPRTWGTLARIKEVSGSAKAIMQDSAGSGAQGLTRSVYGVPVFLSSQISINETRGTSSDTSSAYVVQSDECIVVTRHDALFEVDRSRLFNSDQSEARAKVRADMVVPNPLAVARIVGIRP